MVVMMYVEEVNHNCSAYQQFHWLHTYVVSCPSLTDPNNGNITCSLEDDRVPSYEDTCSFTCNTGYELSGSDTRTCQSGGNWSGSDDVCRRGTFMYDYIRM